MRLEGAEMGRRGSGIANMTYNHVCWVCMTMISQIGHTTMFAGACMAIVSQI